MAPTAKTLDVGEDALSVCRKAEDNTQKHIHRHTHRHTTHKKKLERKSQSFVPVHRLCASTLSLALSSHQPKRKPKVVPNEEKDVGCEVRCRPLVRKLHNRIHCTRIDLKS